MEAGAVRGADVIGQPGGWGVVVKYGTTERALAARRGAVRKFRKFETLVGYLRGIGISQYHVNATDFGTATAAAGSRPDAAARMRRAYEAVHHDTWFRAQVEQGLNEANDASTPWVSNEDVKVESVKRRAQWRAKGAA